MHFFSLLDAKMEHFAHSAVAKNRQEQTIVAASPPQVSGHGGESAPSQSLKRHSTKMKTKIENRKLLLGKQAWYDILLFCRPLFTYIVVLTLTDSKVNT